MINKEIWLDENHENSRYGLKGKILIKKKSSFQDICILESDDFGRALMLDGCWMACDKDEKYYHECLVHPAISSLNKKLNILIIGGGDGGTARECLKYKSVKNVDLVEIDEEVINLSKKYLPLISNNCWNDKRLNIYIDDGVNWVKKNKNNIYDAILVDSSDPSEYSMNLFSEEFYINCKKILENDGIFATQSESPESFKKIHLNIIKTIKNVFERSSTMYGFVPFYPSGIWSWTFASKRNDSEFLHNINKEIIKIEESCEIWNLNYQRGGFNMQPNKISKQLKEKNV
tara:strand:- start:474 stop:1337 length:864 start_codon:yes stop_codon:yes gene_type:complete